MSLFSDCQTVWSKGWNVSRCPINRIGSSNSWSRPSAARRGNLCCLVLCRSALASSNSQTSSCCHTMVWPVCVYYGQPCPHIWVSFCRTGNLAVSRHIFSKSSAFVWPNLKRYLWFFNCSRLIVYCRSWKHLRLTLEICFVCPATASF